MGNEAWFAVVGHLAGRGDVARMSLARTGTGTLLKKLLLGAAAGGLAACSAVAAAETLRDALVSTYRSNPSLNAQREALRASDATVAIAGAQGRPQVGATVGINRDMSRSGVLETGRAKGPVVSGGLDLELPLFQGGRVRNSVQAARARVEAGRGTLRAVEGDIFTDAVAAYMDVIRDRAVVELSENQVQVLTTNLQATASLFRSGDLTRTDIAQSEARLGGARAEFSLAKSRLAVGEERYRQIIGRPPETLVPPPPLPPLPANAEDAVRIALRYNPKLLAATQQARAAGLDVQVARADRLPTVAGVVSGDYISSLRREDGVGRPRTGAQTSVGLTTRIPLYQGGAPAGKVRQARAIEGQLLEQIVAAERAVAAETRSAFAIYGASQEAIQANQIAVAANELALLGTRIERRVGTRTVIEVLNAEQELLTSQVELVSSRRDSYVAGFQLLNAMGQAESKELGLDSGPLYDPLNNYRRVAGSWSDWGGEERYQVSSSPTLSVTKVPTSAPVEASIASAGPNLAVTDPEVAVVISDASLSAPVPVAVAPMDRAVAESGTSPRGPKSGWVIQLGAFRTPGAPHALYARLESQLGGKQPTYRPAGNLTRLLVGPYANKADAAAACRTLASSSACIILPSK